MLRFASADVFDDEIPAADPLGEAPVALPRRRPRRLATAGFMPANPLVGKTFPQWARPPTTPAVGSDGAFFAGANLALFDTILRDDPPFAGALRQRLALRAAAASVKMARLREAASGLRDAEHLAQVGAQTSPAGRIHRLWRLFALRSLRSLRLDAPTLRTAADLIDLSEGVNLEGFAGALRDSVASAEHPLAAAMGASAAAMKLFRDASPVDVEIFALWLSDLALAQRLGWDAPVPLLAAAIAHASLRRGRSGKRPRTADPDWVDAAAGAYAMAAQEAYALAGELARAGEKLLVAQPKLRAKSAGRVVQLLLSDDIKRGRKLYH